VQYLYSLTGKHWDTIDHCNIDPDVPDDLDDTSLVTEDPLDSVLGDEWFEEVPNSHREEENKQQDTLHAMGTF